MPVQENKKIQITPVPDCRNASEQPLRVLPLMVVIGCRGNKLLQNGSMKEARFATQVPRGYGTAPSRPTDYEFTPQR